MPAGGALQKGVTITLNVEVKTTMLSVAVRSVTWTGTVKREAATCTGPEIAAVLLMPYQCNCRVRIEEN